MNSCMYYSEEVPWITSCIWKLFFAFNYGVLGKASSLLIFEIFPRSSLISQISLFLCILQKRLLSNVPRMLLNFQQSFCDWTIFFKSFLNRNKIHGIFSVVIAICFQLLYGNSTCDKRFSTKNGVMILFPNPKTGLTRLFIPFSWIYNNETGVHCCTML